MDSYGYIETYGYVTSIVAADAALKAANVTLRNCYFVKGGIVTVEVTGDVAAVTAAIDAGSEVAKQLGNYISSNVIARLDKGAEKILVDDRKVDDKKGNDKKTEKEVQEPIQQSIKDDFTETVEEAKKLDEEVLVEEVLVESVLEETEKIEKEEKSEIEKEEDKELKKQYHEMRVIELKQKVNNLKLGYTWNEIKGMTRKKLIEILIKNKS